MQPNSKQKRFLFIEPFFGGSHRDFAEGLIAHSRHAFDLVTLPARSWKWRMRGAAFYFRRKCPHLSGYDGIFTTDMIALADFKSFYDGSCPPVLLYFHENQITYPPKSLDERDFHYGFTNLASALAADRILFNSRYHHDDFFDRLPGFLNMMPDYRPMWVIEELRSRSGVCHPGCRFDQQEDESAEKDDPPLIVWNHRWEYDKAPEAFFAALESVSARGIDFGLAILGESFKSVPQVFAAARKKFKNQIRQFGRIESRTEYHNWLNRGAIVVSTAIQENFGISIIEAIRKGCLPLLPNRLSYPEIIDDHLHEEFLYRDEGELCEKLCRLLTHYPAYAEKQETLAEAMQQFSWKNRIRSFDAELDRLCAIRPD